ncbi:MAG: hypothetical protein U0132_02705 [Gemmatimonadaceae bacterium]
MRVTAATRRQRAGTSLVELVVAMALFAVFGSMVLAQLRSNGRSLTALADRTESRSALWQGNDVIATELRPISPVSGDLLLVADSALWYRGAVASGVVCGGGAPNPWLDLLPDSAASGMRFGWGTSAVQAGDELHLFDEGQLPGASDDRWVTLSISSTSRISGLCAGSAYLHPVLDAGKAGYRVRLAVSPPPGALTGATVRITRPARLALYRASTADWWLGWSDWNASLGAWNIIQPVSGAYRPYGANPRPSGIAYRGRDSTGALLIGPTVTGAASQIEVMLRTQVQTARLGIGPSLVSLADSLNARVSLRNRQ